MPPENSQTLAGSELLSVVVIGNFDGVHLGHQAVLRQARALAAARSLRCVVLTFDPHPSEVLGRGLPPQLTTSCDGHQRLRLLPHDQTKHGTRGGGVDPDRD